MTSDAADLRLYGYSAAALAYLALLVHVLRSNHFALANGRRPWMFAAALLASAAWAASSALDTRVQHVGWLVTAALLDWLRYALWLAFLLQLIWPMWRDRSSRAGGLLVPATAAALVVTAVLLLVQVGRGQLDEYTSRSLLTAQLGLAVLGLILLEQFLRNIDGGSRWGAKPVCLGLACVFGFDFYVYSEGLLLGRIDLDVLAVRSTAHLLAVPFLFVASRRSVDWIARLQVSRTAAFYSATLMLTGGYLLFMSAVGYYVRYVGGEWGRTLQLSLLAIGVVGLAVLLFSGSARAWLRVFVGKHFFSYRYDYREEWLRFTAKLSARTAPQEVGERIVRGLADMLECPAGALWVRDGDAESYRQSSRWNMPAEAAREPAASSFCRFLQERAWVVDLQEFRDAPRQYGELAVPTWLLQTPQAWLVVPLHAGDDLLGFVVLSLPRTPLRLDWEVRDLLKTASQQAAGFLAQMQATEALLEARKFDAFNRMSAFVVHDLKNIVAQLSLMLKNAERLHDNREFQQDMLLTIESSLEKMRRLMLQLREGAAPAGGVRGVELLPIVKKLQHTVQAQGRELVLERMERVATRGHPDRLERVLGHLVQNALDATPNEGKVWVSVYRQSGQVRVEVGDTGAGMTEEFIQTRLFRPFSTTKQSGMGIGTYESFQYVRELGGQIEVKSQPGSGTVISILMPTFELQTSSDLLVGNANDSATGFDRT
ncbi:histidine kinase [beta proteobacterium AAP51]|nr:histidine kinase [beta proteobacterium AAP51]